MPPLSFLVPLYGMQLAYGLRMSHWEVLQVCHQNAFITLRVQK